MRIEHTDQTVVVKLGPIGSLFALKGRLDIPRAHITNVEVMGRSDVPAPPGAWLRAPGTHIPGVMRFGSYGREPLREFWLVVGRQRVLVIDVRDWAYHRVVLGSSDADGLAMSVRVQTSP